ncbi:epimerase family protein SDR39U1 homolog, chloroplastic-like isoform X2 [Phalaenopsis equestris]|uniref:epimerase family protein SDR39U1 homolog, chloroplastic-like isoform X2 n=1 Tax=Phalaenopsis equestris TaxID=78828 RepID=UPI0009E41A92|nr:epimerase family protein SDR39U1 homolog, chloroplastic-like isoform X2 [Phalaenopsis equestris]
MVLCRAPLSLFIASPVDNSANSLTPSISLFHISSPLNSHPDLLRRSSNRGRVVCISDTNGGFVASQSSKKSQLVVSITGATGFIGRRLVQKLIADDHIVRILTRSRRNALLVFPGRRFPEIVIAEEEGWNKCIEGSNAVVNLAGMPISTRWSSEVKKEIKQSRVKVTSKVVDLINKMNSSTRPSVLISATAIGYYGTSETEVFDEKSPSGNDYLAELSACLSLNVLFYATISLGL